MRAGQDVEVRTRFDDMQVGQDVEVRTRFDNSWAPGFEIAEVVENHYRVRRVSDGALLPNLTGSSDLRPSSRGETWEVTRGPRG